MSLLLADSHESDSHTLSLLRPFTVVILLQHSAHSSDSVFQSPLEAACKFGNEPAKDVMVIQSTNDGDTTLQITSPSTTDPNDTKKTVRISWTSNPAIYVQFSFQYIWVTFACALYTDNLIRDL